MHSEAEVHRCERLKKLDNSYVRKLNKVELKELTIILSPYLSSFSIYKFKGKGRKV